MLILIESVTIFLIQAADHRRALARIVSSDHRLAVEVLRRGDGQRPGAAQLETVSVLSAARKGRGRGVLHIARPVVFRTRMC